jgi:CMP/dCMP kinase
MKLKKKIKIAIDSPAAAGAGTQAKLISNHFKLFYLDTGKIYRLIANIKLTQPNKYGHGLIKKKICKIKNYYQMKLEQWHQLYQKIKK